MARELGLAWRRWVAAALRAALPSHCALCGMAAGGIICVPCHADYVAPQRPRCRVCANPVADHRIRTCGRCLAHPPPFDATVAAVDYAAPLDRLVLQLKFAARLPYATWLAQAMTDAVLAQPHLELPHVLCPVPLGPKRLAERGFNQALEIARPLSRSLGIPLRPRLACRPLDTRAQSSISPRERHANLRNAFTLPPESVHLVRGLHIGVVDDVMTSGHTLAALAATLKRFGAARVTNIVFARTPPSTDAQPETEGNRSV
ncbi:ComF family protein [Massilia arenosa]|uniref:ComF family protein n=1 Tax=Zemynaea arenosa TaxID=2561931 RepID=A0A4Y9RMZ9_9BURK|nr:ComF family protein [Massilia arenosa]TFW10657.1 ComF family protein [Massilia arenosa]